jgi:hypothetical protein
MIYRFNAYRSEEANASRKPNSSLISAGSTISSLQTQSSAIRSRPNQTNSDIAPKYTYTPSLQADVEHKLEKFRQQSDKMFTCRSDKQ